MSQTGEMMGEMTGEIWEGCGRDLRHLSHALSLLYKELSKNYGRDDRYLGFYILPKKYYCDRFSAHKPNLSQYRFRVATTQEEIKIKTWNEPKFVLPLHRQSGQTRLLSDNKKRI